MKAALFFCAVFFLLSGCTKDNHIDNDLGSSFTYKPEEIGVGVSIGDIYKTGNFAAFTDLAYYNNSWYSVFRVGTEHVGGANGQIKVLKSKDLVTWKIEKIIKIDSLDLRDPKLVIDSINGHLYINFFGNNNNVTKNFLVSSDSVGWSIPDEITYDDDSKDKFIFWRLTYKGGKMYCAAYRTPIFGGYTMDNIGLFEGEKNFQHYKSLGRVDLGGSANEATIRFDAQNKMYFLVRTERTNVALGIASAPSFNKVKWLNTTLLVRLASPNFLIYNGKLLITGRDVVERTFKFYYYDQNTNTVLKSFTFPSGYETGYGGMSFNPENQNELLITYYSITSAKSYIKLARVNLNKFLK